MNIIEAVGKSNRRVRPATTNTDFMPLYYWVRLRPTTLLDYFQDDWEVEEKRVEISESQLEAVLQKLHGENLSISQKGVSRLKKELGLTD